MIASFEHGYIFIKTKKTAGTSVEMALSPSCGPDDIITPIDIEAEIARRSGEEVLARNFAAGSPLEDAYREAVRERDRAGAVAIRTELRHQGHFHAHMKAEAIQAAIPAEFWSSAFKFTVERHPYEKAVSHTYFLMHQRQMTEGFAELLDKTVRRGDIVGLPFYSVGGKIAVDEILRQESLEKDLRGVAARLGFALPETIPRGKSQSRLDRRPAREILSQEQKSILQRRCREEFDLLGYEP